MVIPLRKPIDEEDEDEDETPICEVDEICLLGGRYVYPVPGSIQRTDSTCEGYFQCIYQISYPVLC